MLMEDLAPGLNLQEQHRKNASAMYIKLGLNKFSAVKRV